MSSNLMPGSTTQHIHTNRDHPASIDQDSAAEIKNGSGPFAKIFESNRQTMGQQQQPAIANMTNIPRSQSPDLVKLDMKTQEWAFSFEGTYAALCKTLESLGDISDHMSYIRRQ